MSTNNVSPLGLSLETPLASPSTHQPSSQPHTQVFDEPNDPNQMAIETEDDLDVSLLSSYAVLTTRHPT